MVRSDQSGQILLIVVLTMIVALTVGLSIAARVVTELKLSKQNEESQRAFQAAESGIQQTLERGDDVGNVPLDNNSSFSTVFLKDEGPSIVMNNGIEVDQSIGADVWLSDYSATSTALFDNSMGTGAPVPIRMYWGDPAQSSCVSGGGDTVAPAIEVVLLKGPVGNPSIQKNVFEACAPPNHRIENAISGDSSSSPISFGGSTFRYWADLVFDGSPLSDGLIMKVIPIFNSSKVGFEYRDADPPDNPPVVFPGQGSIVESTGVAGDTVRKVIYYQSYPQLPLEIFPYSIISK